MGARLLFAGNFRWNAGHAQVIAQYHRAAEQAGCEVGVSTELSRVDTTIARHLPLVDDLGWATHLVVLLDAPQFLSHHQRRLCERFPRHRRIVIDGDMHAAEEVAVGRDSSVGVFPADEWHELIASLSDTVLQPSFRQGALFHPFFGLPPSDPDHVGDEPDLAMQYIGNNWWRWESARDAVTTVRAALGPDERIRLHGMWWNRQSLPGYEEATYSDPVALRRWGVELAGSVPVGTLIRAMSQALLTPVLIRPVLAEFQLLTPRMFETLAAHTIPLVGREFHYVQEVYGPAGKEFETGDDPVAKVRDMAERPAHYHAARLEAHAWAAERFGYVRVLRDLLEFAE